MKKDLNYLVIILLILGIGYFSVTSYRNIVNNPKSTFSINHEIKNTKLKLDKVLNSIDESKKILSNKNIQLENLKNELSHFNVISNKSSIGELKKSIIELNLKNLCCDIRLNNIGSQTQSVMPLNSTFIYNNLNDREILNNINFLPIYLEYSFNSSLNTDISKHNIEVLKYLGILEYLDNGNNYLIKSKLLKDYTNLTNINKSAYEIYMKENNYLNLFKDCEVINFQGKLSEYTDNLDEKVEIMINNEKIENPDFKDINLLLVFSYDILNTGVSHLTFLNVVENSTEKILEDKNGRKFMINTSDGKDEYLKYYDSKGNVFSSKKHSTQ